MITKKKIPKTKWVKKVEAYCKKQKITPEDLIECHQWLKWINKLPSVKNLPQA